MDFGDGVDGCMEGKFIFDVNIYAFLILAMLYGIQQKNYHSRRRENRAFDALLLFGMGGLAADYISTRLPGMVPDGIVQTAMLLTFAFCTVLGGLCLYWTCMQFSLPTARIRCWEWGIASLCLLDLFLLFGSLSTGWYFWFDGTGGYHRGPLFLLHSLLALSGVLAAVLSTVWYHHFLQRPIMWRLLFFLSPVLAASLLSLLFPAYSFETAGAAFALLCAYIMIQNCDAEQDMVTGLYNRLALESYISHQIQDCLPDMQFAVLTVHLDNLHQINVDYGHRQGDEALRTIADMLAECLSTEAFLARASGHVFCVVLPDIRSSEELVRLSADIRQAADSLSVAPDKIQLCVQTFYDVYSLDLGRDAAVFLRQMEAHL